MASDRILNDADYWIRRRAEELKHLRKVAGKSRAAEMIAGLGDTTGWSDYTWALALIELRTKAVVEVATGVKA